MYSPQCASGVVARAGGHEQSHPSGVPTAPAVTHPSTPLVSSLCPGLTPVMCKSSHLADQRPRDRWRGTGVCGWPSFTMPINSMHLGSEVLPRKDQGAWVQLESSRVEAKIGSYEASLGISCLLFYRPYSSPLRGCSNPIKQMGKLRPKAPGNTGKALVRHCSPPLKEYCRAGT